MLVGRYSLLPITSVSFELREFIFCLLHFGAKTPVPNVIAPPVCPLMSGCTAWEESINVSMSPNESIPMIRGSSIVCWMNLSVRLNFFQSSTSGDCTLVHRKLIGTLISNRARWETQSSLATIEWKISALSSLNFLALASTSKIHFAATDATVGPSSSPKSSIHSWR